MIQVLGSNTKPLGPRKEAFSGTTMNTIDFTPGSSLAGGALIGLAASLLLLASGRVAGISGIAVGALRGAGADRRWRALFLMGLLLSGAAMAWLAPSVIAASPRSLLGIGVAGLLVGVGTRLGSGCTSGHGVCGISRRSPRSLLATAAFMAAGAATVALVRVFGGAA